MIILNDEDLDFKKKFKEFFQTLQGVFIKAQAKFGRTP